MHMKDTLLFSYCASTDKTPHFPVEYSAYSMYAAVLNHMLDIKEEQFIKSVFPLLSHFLCNGLLWIFIRQHITSCGSVVGYKLALQRRLGVMGVFRLSLVKETQTESTMDFTKQQSDHYCVCDFEDIIFRTKSRAVWYSMPVK